ncbi:MAG: aspartate carbamoyltransferase [Candidatus Pacearchaeota archaeon]|nr:aspartate carbamoyltransferase [Candidatus Pacearchaeota archaeon]
MSKFFNKDIISMNDFSRDDIDFILNYAVEIKENPEKFKSVMKGKIMAPLFFENSTRTSTSFQMSMLHMGGSVMDFDVSTSSVKKGETLRDTLMMVKGYKPDIVVLRHLNGGAARLASNILDCSVMNAGDGQNQHPTQTLLDLFSIKEIRGEVDGLRIAMVGDLKYGRTIHSLALALAKYSNCKIYFVAPDILKMPKSILDDLKLSNLEFVEYDLDSFSNILSKVDIVYMTRIQRERFPAGREGEQDYNLIKKNYCLNKEMLNGVSSDLKIMHPLPKVFEIAPEIDKTSFAYYFKQAENGLYVRQALLCLVLGENMRGAKNE